MKVALDRRRQLAASAAPLSRHCWLMAGRSRTTHRGDDAQARAIDQPHRTVEPTGCCSNCRIGNGPGRSCAQIQKHRSARLTPWSTTPVCGASRLLAMTPDRDWDDIMNINLAEARFAAAARSCRR